MESEKNVNTQSSEEDYMRRLSIKDVLIHMYRNLKDPVRVVTIPLREYESLKDKIHSLKSRVEMMEKIKFPRLAIEYKISPLDPFYLAKSSDYTLSRNLSFEVDAAIPKDDERFKEIWEILSDGVAKVKEGDKSSREMINGLRKASDDFREQLKRVPWYLSWLIKPEGKVKKAPKVPHY